MKKSIVFISLLIISALFLSADYYIKQNVHTDALSMMGQSQPAKDEVSEMWVGKDRFAMHGGSQSFIVDLTKNLAYMVMHQSKNYLEMTLPLDMSKYLPEQFTQMMGSITATVTPTGETQKIGKWDCQGYDVALDMMMMKMKMKVWATTNVPFDWKTFQEKMFLQMSQAMMRLGDEALQELMKIQGLQVKSEATVSVMGSDMKSSTEVVELFEKAAPEGTYTVPAGYTKLDKLSIQDLMKRGT